MSASVEWIVKSNKIPTLIDNLDKAQRKPLRFLADDIHEEVKAITPVRTGDLRDSERVEEVSDTEMVFIAGGGPKGVAYAHYVEFGTRFMPPNPYVGQGSKNAITKFDFKKMFGAAIVEEINS